MALPNDKISTTLVANTLGTSSRDAGTLCTHPSINKWSKWKPIKLAKVTGITLTDLQNANWGLSIYQNNSLSTLKTYVSSNDGVAYVRPTGGSSSPYRLGDFRNYEHSATTPFGTGANSGTTVQYTIKKGSTAIEDYFSIIGLSYNIGGTYNIGWDELYPSTNLYIGAHLTNISNNEEFWLTGEDPIGGLNSEPKFNWSNPAIRYWNANVRVTMFVTNVKKADGDTYNANSADRFYAVTTDQLNYNPFTITVNNEYADGSLVFFVDGYIYYHGAGTNKVSYDLKYSSIGSVYRGGNITNPALKYFSDSGYTTELYSVSFTPNPLVLGAESEISFFNSSITVSSGSAGDLYFRVYGNNKVVLQGMCARPLDL